MPKIYPNLEAIARYEECPNINQSGLKEIEDKGIQSFLQNRFHTQKRRKDFESAEHFLIGHACDDKMCFPKEHYDSLYHYSSLAKLPSDTLRTVLHMLLDRLSGETNIFQLGYREYNEALHNCLDEVPTKDSKTGKMKLGYYMNQRQENWQLDTRVNNVLNDPLCIAYWKDIVTARGKEVLDEKNNLLITQITDNWLCHPNTEYVFREDPTVWRVYQFPVYFEVNGIGCKGLIDKIDIHTKHYKKIVPYDFKTMNGHTLTFPKTVKKRRYDLQGSFYYRGLSQSLQSLSDLVGFDVRDFHMDYMTFIVESTTNPGFPIRMQLSEELHLVGERGDKDQDLKGYEQMLDDYEYWLKRDFQPPTGVIEIDSQFKMLNPQ